MINPYWNEIYPLDDNPSDEEYPLRFFVGLREDEYFHSAGRHVKRLRQRNPEPLAILHTETARESVINDEAIEIFLGLLKNSLSAFHAVIVHFAIFLLTAVTGYQ